MLRRMSKFKNLLLINSGFIKDKIITQNFEIKNFFNIIKFETVFFFFFSFLLNFSNFVELHYFFFKKAKIVFGLPKVYKFVLFKKRKAEKRQFGALDF